MSSFGITSLIGRVFGQMDDEDKMLLLITVSVSTLFILYLVFVDHIRSVDDLIRWLASWPVWIIRKIIYFIRRFIEEMINGLKDAFTKPI